MQIPREIQSKKKIQKLERGLLSYNEEWKGERLYGAFSAEIVEVEGCPGKYAIVSDPNIEQEEADSYDDENGNFDELEVITEFGRMANFHRTFMKLAFKDDPEFLKFTRKYGRLWFGSDFRQLPVQFSFPDYINNHPLVIEPLIFWKWHAERVLFLTKLVDVVGLYKPETGIGTSLAERITELWAALGPQGKVGFLTFDAFKHPLFPGTTSNFRFRYEPEDLVKANKLEEYFPWVPELDLLMGDLDTAAMWDQLLKGTDSLSSNSNQKIPSAKYDNFIEFLIENLANTIASSVQRFSIFSICPYSGDVDFKPQGILGLAYTHLLQDFNGKKMSELRTCKGCDRTFRPSRSDLQFCTGSNGKSSNACRQKYLRRQKQALKGSSMPKLSSNQISETGDVTRERT